MDGRFDVVVVGGSFAGLAVASRLRGNVLIVDKEPLGTHQVSACGTFLSVPRTLGLLDSVIEASERALIHAPGVPAYELEDALCTLDYERFCRGLLAQSPALFVQASFQGLEGTPLEPVVRTSEGRFAARYVVDASGWRAVVASSLKPGFVDRSALSYGLETECEYRADSFYFWLDRKLIEDGVGWIFPAGERSRVGLASYRGESIKATRVAEFLRVAGAGPSSFHGGFFPSGLRAGAVGPVFLVGDSAGQCLPLTGEGIRPALYFGQICGDLLRRVMDGNLSPRQAIVAQRQVGERFRWHYRFLALAQRRVPSLPSPLLHGLLSVLEAPRVGRWCLRRYVGAMPLQPPLQESGFPRQPGIELDRTAP